MERRAAAGACRRGFGGFSDRQTRSSAVKSVAPVELFAWDSRAHFDLSEVSFFNSLTGTSTRARAFGQKGNASAAVWSGALVVRAGGGHLCDKLQLDRVIEHFAVEQNPDKYGSTEIRRAYNVKQLVAGTRSDQRHLLVELELDDSVVIAPARYDNGNYERSIPAKTHTRDISHRRVSATDAYEDSFNHRYPQHPSQYAAFEEHDQVFETGSATRGNQRPQSAKSRASCNDNAMKSSRSQSTLYPETVSVQARNAQQKLLSPYKLKQRVLSSRHHLDPTSDLIDRDGRRVTRNTSVRESPSALLSTSLRQNAQLRDELVAQLQQEVSSNATSMSQQDRLSPSQLSPRLVKMLNKLRSLSLSIVEMQLYFCREILTSAEPPAAVAHLEQELHAYLLQMISSDVDFLSCSTSLIRIFDSNSVSLVRNPFVEGLSLDSSELLLCSCNHVSSSSYSSSAFSSPYPSSSTASSSSLFQLLVHKLETFALYMRKHVSTWQVLPPDRVAVALLHLIELENRVNATRLLPSYLRPPSAASSSRSVSSERSRFVLASSSASEAHRQPPSRTEFIETEDNVEREIPLHPRSSFVAWHTSEKQHEGEASRVEERPLDTTSARITSVAPSVEEAFISSPAAAKQQSAARASAKKRKGSKSGDTVAARDKPVEANLPRDEKSSSHVARGDETSETKPSGDSLYKSQAMTLLNGARPSECVNNIEACGESIQPSSSLDSAEVVASATSVRIATLPDAHLSDPVLNVAKELLADQRSKNLPKPLSTCELSASTTDTVRVEALEANAERSKEDLSAQRCFQQISTPLANSDSRSVQEAPGSNEDRDEDDKFVRGIATSDEVTDDSMLEYSPETTRSMIASALGMLPSLDAFGSTESSLPTLLVTSGSSLPDSVRLKRSSDDETSPEHDTLPGVSKASNELIVYDFELAPEDEQWMVDHTPEKHLASDNSNTCKTEEPVLEKIYALCRDVQVAALDMGYHLDHLIEKEHKLPSTVASPIMRPVPSFYEPPMYLERELKMLRRYFRPWRDFALGQTEAKRILRRRTALRQICCFVYDTHRARQFALLQLESLTKNAAAGRIQSAWALHLLHVRVMRKKTAFRSAHMAFKRFVFYTRTIKCRRRHEAAKERIHRWWRRRRDALRKQEAGRVRQYQLQQRRHQAAKGVQCFFRESILRQRLARVAAENQQILLKSQLFSLKARQEEDKRRKKELKRQRELERSMKGALDDLEAKWKRSEAERTKLLRRHQRVLGRHQLVEEKRRRELARLKITAFLDSCLLHRKIKRVVREKAENHEQWLLVSREKAALECDTEQWRAQDKLQLRVLHRKLAKLESEKVSLTKTQQALLETHKQRSQQLHEHIARTKIKAFIDARILHAKARRERLEQLRVQREILAVKDEQERMVREEISERDRIAQAEKEQLEQLLDRAQQDVTSLTLQQQRLIAEKALEAAAAQKAIEAAVADKNRIVISKWLSDQVRTSRERSKFARENAELAHAVEMERQGRLAIEREKEVLLRKREEEKRSQQVKDNFALLQKRKSHMKQQMIAEKRQREAATSAICSFIERRIQSSRNVLAGEQRRLQEEKNRHYDLQRQLELQKLLVAVVVDIRFVAEKLTRVSIESATSSVDHIAALLYHKHTRLQHLKCSSSARKVQRCWQSWRRAEQHRKLEEDRAIRAQAMHCHYCARTIQRSWRLRRAMIKQGELAERERERQEHCLAIRRCVCSRRIQRGWRRWHGDMIETQKRLAREEKLLGLRRSACARNIQHCWRRWQLKLLRIRLQLKELKRLERVALIRRRCCARRIQRWILRVLEKIKHLQAVEVEQRRYAHKDRQDQLERVRKRASARKIQQRWRRSRVEAERRRQAQKTRQKQLEQIRERASARKLQRQWKRWRVEAEEHQNAADELANQCLEAELVRLGKAHQMRRQACVRKIQQMWQRWRAALNERREAAVKLERECREAEVVRLRQGDKMRRDACARKIQRKWRRWHMLVKERRRVALVLAREYLEAKTARAAHSITLRRRVCARKIQRQWRKWTEADRSTQFISAELDRIHRRVCGRRILRKWREWRKKREEIRIVNAAVLIETAWRGYYTRQQFASVKEAKRHEESRLFELRLSGFARKIQLCWGQWLKRVWKARRAAVKLQEDKLIHEAKNASIRRLIRSRQESAAVVIQSRWAGYRCRVIYVSVRKQLLERLIYVEMTATRHNADGALVKHTSPQSDAKNDREVDQAATARAIQANRLGFRLELQQWVCHQLPAILSEGISAAKHLNCAAHAVQRAYRGFRSRQQLRFCIKRPAKTAGGDEDSLQFLFSRGQAWMTSKSYSGVRLRFSSLMTRKLLLMFNPGAHTALELQEALEEIAVDVQPIIESAVAGSSGHSKDSNQDIDVDEMDLPGFCVLTRKMGRIRSMHKRSHESPVSRASPSKFAQQECVELTIFDAVASASVEDAQFLLDQGVNAAAALDPVTGRGALHTLAFCTESYRFRLEMLEFLINNGRVNVNAVDDHGETPLMLFAINGHLELMRKLIDYGADWSITNKKGQNVLHRACELDQVEVCGYLHEQFSLRARGNASEVDASHGSLLLHDADSSGRTPLHILAEKGFAECAKQLVFPTEDRVQKQFCHLLLRQCDVNGRTPLHLAILSGHFDITTLLLENTPNEWIDHADSLRRSPVHLCVYSTNAVQVTSLLFDHGANMNATDERGDTPLHYAALSGRVAVVQTLLDCGADPSAFNNDWEIPAQVAAAYGHFGCSRLLLNAQKQRDGVDQDLLSLEAELEQQQASGKSYYYKPPSPTASMVPTGNGTHSARCETSARVGYWEELHQEVQLVEESGNFSSEDEGFLDQDDDEEEPDQNEF